MSLVLESKTSDYSANAGNSGKIFQRTDATSATGKVVVEYTSGGNPAYAVKSLTFV